MLSIPFDDIPEFYSIYFLAGALLGRAQILLNPFRRTVSVCVYVCGLKAELETVLGSIRL